MRKLIVIGSCAAGLALAAAAWSSAPAITPTSIAGARLGQSAADYRKLLGAAQALTGTNADPSHPEDYSRLYFAKREMEVYFKGKTNKAIEITTWNRAYRTPAGVGPCSTVAQLKKAYGASLKASPDNSHGNTVFAYVVGRNMLFATNANPYVTAVAIFTPSAHREPTLGYAGYVVLNEVNCF